RPTAGWAELRRFQGMSVAGGETSCNVEVAVSMDCVATKTSRFACARGGGQVAAKTGETKTSETRIAAAANIRAIGLVSVRKHFESFESFVVQSGDLIREGHHRCGRRRTADVTTAANCDIRVT